MSVAEMSYIHLARWVIFYDFLSSVDFFQNHLFRKFFQCQTLWIQIRPDILSGLIWVQTVCKAYQQMAKSPLSCKELNILAEWLLTVMVGNQTLSCGSAADDKYQVKLLLESFDLNSIKEPANTRNTKPTVRLGCSFHELLGPTLFLFPLTRPCFTGMGRSVGFFLKLDTH